MSKNELGRDYGVPPLEALWWSDDMAAFTTARDKSRWNWTALILLPGWLGAEHVDTVGPAVAAKAPALDRLRVEELDEGLVVQTLHVGRTTTRRRCWRSCTSRSSRRRGSR